ncbi:hypothetical protein JHL21_12305 [Devosia sp. WQ 349]|uniref:hypothetical protein n=1 Tax=Devosia sp. WQ 349K1 TaxID=2800329 RepID=UPI001905581C|nr:hypothetical protein [Devosia sp. WQ 349K1]MBK1795280.1 hypothetical protein [Devosia sp. WQ 349K1]
MSGDRSSLERREWALVGAVWLGAVVVMLYRVFAAGEVQPLFADTDDAMRLAFARDFLNGQPWFDFIAHRLNTPFGAELHWSRFVDLPIVALLAVSTWVFGASTAVVVTGMVWPLLLLAVLIYLTVRITKTLVGPEGVLPAALLPVLNPALMAEFSPGRLDHHNVVVVLTLATVLATLIGQRRSVGAWLAGFFAAFSIAVAIEALPLVAGAILAFGLAYVLDGQKRHAMMRFGISFALSSAFFLATARMPDRWLEAACDMISPVYVLAAALVGLSYCAVALLPQQNHAFGRLALLALFGAGTLSILAFAYPQCLQGPYSTLDPWLQANWLNNIVEARPWHVSLVDGPVYALVVTVPVVLGLIIGVVALRRGVNIDLWLALVCFLALASLAMLFQIRGARLATSLSVPMAAWLIVVARQNYLRNTNLLSTLGLLVSWLVSAGAVLGLGGNAVLALTGNAPSVEASLDIGARQECLLPDAFVDLAGLPVERIMTPIDLGAHMMLYTPHHVVAAPYHRNEQGVLDAFRFFQSSEADALAIARKRGLNLVVTCPSMPEMGVEKSGDGRSLLRLIVAGQVPEWLHEVPSAGPLKVYAIAPE